MSSNKSRRMIRSFIMASLPIAAVMSDHAIAQSVTFFGSVDAALVNASNGATGSDSTGALSSGVLTPSRLGIIGDKDLGGNLKAKLLLEAGLDSDTGALKTYSGNPTTATAAASNGTSTLTGFNRRAFVGLEGSLGTLTVGRDYTPFYYTALQTDPMGLTLFGNIQAMTIPAGGVERWGRVSNALFYTSPLVNGFKGRVTYSLGSESPGGVVGSQPKGSNIFAGISGDYSNGGLLISASYQELSSPVVVGVIPTYTGSLDKRLDAALGAKYSFDKYSVSGGFWKMDSSASATDIWLGGSAKYGALKILAIVQNLHQDNPAGADKSGAIFGIGGVYDLNSTTAIYATYGQVTNSATASFALFSADSAVTAGTPGASINAVGFGIRHNF